MIQGGEKTRKALKELKRKLPHGAITRISNELGKTRTHVDQVFDGRYNDDTVIAKANEILAEQIEKVSQRNERITEALKKADLLQSMKTN